MDELAVAAVRLATPLLLAALGELVAERAGVVNIGIEGMMLVGAFAGFCVAVASGSPALGAGAGVLAGGAVGVLFALFAVLRRADQIVTGTAVNLLALGTTGLGLHALFPEGAPTAPTTGAGFVPAAFALALATGVFLMRTRPGLRLRVVGESARAADAEGVPVARVRCAAVVFGGAMAGLAGASLPLWLSNTFTEGMTAGRGFIALAIVIFGRWRAEGALAASLLFGAATALQFRLQARGFDVPYPLFLMLPYVVTLAALAVASGRTGAPADLARPYEREAR